MTSRSDKTCPKCGYARTAVETAPAWQCPACGIAYHKYAAYLQRMAALPKRPAGTDARLNWHVDHSLWVLLAANLFALVIALLADWSLLSMLLVYWGQSVVIGIAAVIRILALDEFSTAGFRINGERPGEVPATKRSTAFFFALHYGFFHVVYLMFLVIQGDGGELNLEWSLIILGFAANHLYSLHYNIEADREGKPNIGTLMFMPYLRILPMHLVIIFGATLDGQTATLVLFVLLKTLADVAMHIAEHIYFAKLRAAPAMDQVVTPGSDQDQRETETSESA